LLHLVALKPGGVGVGSAFRGVETTGVVFP